MIRRALFIFVFILAYAGNLFSQEITEVSVEEGGFLTTAPSSSQPEHPVFLRSNILPWGIAIPNLGVEFILSRKWSLAMDVWYSPWNISDKFAVKTAAIFPEGRWWLKENGKGSFFNLHLNIAWFNVRANKWRYQDHGRPLLGAGIGYGYRLPVNKRWSFEFEIGAGMANMRYDRFYNVPNGQLKDTRVTTYWGIDRANVSVCYYLCDI